MELPKRKNTRLPEYDYSKNGAYFITICTHGHKCILSTIERVGDGLPDVPKNKYTAKGKIAEKYIKQMNEYYNHISVEKYVIMPNHIHMIIYIHGENGTSGTPSPTNSVIAKYVSTFKRFCNREYGYNIWQRSYHDHVIRGAEDYKNIWEYMDNNPAKWNLDRYWRENT